MEELIGDEALFLEKPAEDKAGEQTDEAGGTALFVDGFQICGELDLRECPEIPVREFLVESLVEELDVENLLPSGVERIEIGEGKLLRVGEVSEGEGCENILMSAVGGNEGNVANEGDFFEHVLIGMDLVLAPIDDGDGETRAVLEKDHDGHGKDSVDLPGDGGKFATGVMGILQFNGEEYVGLQEAWPDFRFFEEG